MKHKVWRSLDRPSSFFGIRGRFMRVLLGLGGAGAVAALAAGSVFGGLAGMLVLALSLAGAYMAVTSLQGKMSDRGLSRRLASRRIPPSVRIQPRPFLSYLKSFDPQPWK